QREHQCRGARRRHGHLCDGAVSRRLCRRRHRWRACIRLGHPGRAGRQRAARRGVVADAFPHRVFTRFRETGGPHRVGRVIPPRGDPGMLSHYGTVFTAGNRESAGVALEKIFKAYDIRGRVPEELDEATAFRIGWAFATYLGAQRIVVGGDVRDSSPRLLRAAAPGMEAAGAKVSSIGLCGTEEIYFATFHYEFDGGMMITASHNPIGWNGMKLVGDNARPLSGDEGLAEVRALCAQAPQPDFTREPSLVALSHREAL